MFFEYLLTIGRLHLLMTQSRINTFLAPCKLIPVPQPSIIHLSIRISIVSGLKFGNNLLPLNFRFDIDKYMIFESKKVSVLKNVETKKRK